MWDTREHRDPAPAGARGGFNVNGALLRETRMKAGLSAREVAAEAGVCSRSVERAESRWLQPETYNRYLEAILAVLRKRIEEVQALLGFRTSQVN